MNKEEEVCTEEAVADEGSSVPPEKGLAPPQPATKSQLKEAEEKIDERMSAFERSTIRLTRIGLFVGILTMIIFLGQFFEMYEAGTQTIR
ncbi:MAG TPA: hypothetical protein VN670_01885 [Acidobacteriaceae bacterium]|nr:hypothetical protein [Acidobacteriaceae bacterium]